MAKADYYKALTSRDSRFDGVFFNCVKTTGIYCRPICPTHPPRIENCLFVSSAAEAEKLGYRPCLRCRPELAPLVSLADDSSARLLRQHIDDTLLRDETLEQIAKDYKLSSRHLRRQFVKMYGVEPKQYLTTRRLLFAKQLLQETQLRAGDIAYTTGFNTPARLTINMRKAYGFTPERFRKGKVAHRTDYLTLRADYRPPLDWDGLLAILKDRATPLETIEDGLYKRVVDGATIIVSNDSQRNRLAIRIPVEHSREVHTIVRNVRRLFDLDANPFMIDRALSADPLMKQLVRQHPGTRVPGAWDHFELLIRVIIGQQISVARATAVTHRLIDRIGGTPEAITKSTPAAIAAIGLPLKRAETIHRVANLVNDGQLNLTERNPELFHERLLAIPGIGEWTAEYACLRILHWPDAFPASDLGIQKALGVLGESLSEKQVAARSQAWQPWRSYAAMLLWRSLNNQGG